MISKTREVRYKITGEDKTKAATESAKGNLASLSNAARAVGPLISAAFGAAVLKNAANNYIRQEQAIFQLEQRLKSTGGAAGRTSQDLQQMASSLQGVTTFGDETIIEMQSLLLTFTQIQGVNFDGATEAILNVSQAMGQDLKSSAVQVGKALNDPILGVSALSKSGIQFSKDQKAMIKSLVETGDVAGAQKVILKELEVQFGGAARAAAQGLGGALMQLSNASSDASEKLGERLAPGLTVLAQEMLRVTEEGGSMSMVLDGVEVTFETLTVGALTTAFALSQLGGGIGAVAAAASFAVTGEFKLASAALAAYGDDVEAEYLRLEKQVLSLKGLVSDKKPSSFTPVTGGRPAFEPFAPQPTTQKTGPPKAPEQEDTDFFLSPQLGASTSLMGDGQRDMASSLSLLGVPNQQVMDYGLTVIEDFSANKYALMEAWAAAELELISNTTAEKENIEISSYSFLANAKAANASTALSLINMIGQKSKALMLAGLVVTKGIAMAETFVAGQAAAAAALAPPPLGLGPVAGVKLAAAIETQTYVRMGLIAATGLVQAAQASGGGGGALNSGAGTYTSPVITQPQQGIGQGGGNVTIILNGAIGEREWFENNVPQIMQDLSARNVNIGYQPRAD